MADDSPWQQHKQCQEKPNLSQLILDASPKSKKTRENKRNGINLLTIILPRPFFCRLRYLCTFVHKTKPYIHVESGDKHYKRLNNWFGHERDPTIQLKRRSLSAAFVYPNETSQEATRACGKWTPATTILNGEFIGEKYLWPRLSSLKVPRSLPCIKCPNIFLPSASPGILLHSEY